MSDFRERLLRVMERKLDPHWSRFTSGEVPKDRLHIHLEHEWEVYVRDFPVLIGGAYVQCPIAEVRRELAENLYEEETGGLHAGRPHPQLFLEYPRGLGFDLARFERVDLLPAARRYQRFLQDATRHRGWEIATAIATLFVEGTAHERGVLDPDAPTRPEPPLEQHPLVVHYGLPLESLALTKAHRGVEGEHREAAWRVTGHMVEHDAVVAAMEDALALWLDYRAAVAGAVGLR